MLDAWDWKPVVAGALSYHTIRYMGILAARLSRQQVTSDGSDGCIVWGFLLCMLRFGVVDFCSLDTQFARIIRISSWLFDVELAHHQTYCTCLAPFSGVASCQLWHFRTQLVKNMRLFLRKLECRGDRVPQKDLWFSLFVPTKRWGVPIFPTIQWFTIVLENHHFYQVNWLWMVPFPWLC